MLVNYIIGNRKEFENEIEYISSYITKQINKDMSNQEIEKIRDKVSLIKIYEPIIKYPAVKRDLAIIVDKDIDSGRIEKIFKNDSNNLLKNIELFDIYTGNQINKGKKSMAYKLTFQSKEKTLVDEDINSLINNMLFDLKEQLGAYLRF